MKHLTYADKSLLVGDEVGELLLEYAAEIGRRDDVDDVTITALDVDGGEVSATLLLGRGAPVMIETSESDLPEPDASDTVAHLRRRLAELREPAPGLALDEGDLPEIDEFDVSLPPRS